MSYFSSCRKKCRNFVVKILPLSSVWEMLSGEYMTVVAIHEAVHHVRANNKAGYYNVIVTQHQLDDNLKHYLESNEIVYNKKKMNGTYQVGSGRSVTFTHDTPFIVKHLPRPRRHSTQQVRRLNRNGGVSCCRH